MAALGCDRPRCTWLELPNSGECRPHRSASNLSRLRSWPVQLVEGALEKPDSFEQHIPEGVDAIFHVAGNISFWRKDTATQIRDNDCAVASIHLFGDFTGWTVAVLLGLFAAYDCATSPGVATSASSLHERQPQV
jgi:hypothetical protein